ncbi:Lrp/AsnC family transcriptional regulator [Candidatus Harpocratesius sp.]
MNERRSFLDDIDKILLKELQKNCQIPRSKLAEIVKVSLSTINYRIKRLEQEGIIQGYHAHINLTGVQEEFNICLLLKAKIHPNYIVEVSSLLESIQEVWAVYATLGSKNFVIFAHTPNQHTFMNKVYQELLNSHLIEDIDMLVINNILKEDCLRRL